MGQRPHPWSAFLLMSWVVMELQPRAELSLGGCTYVINCSSPGVVMAGAGSPSCPGGGRRASAGPSGGSSVLPEDEAGVTPRGIPGGLHGVVGSGDTGSRKRCSMSAHVSPFGGELSSLPPNSRTDLVPQVPLTCCDPGVGRPGSRLA